MKKQNGITLIALVITIIVLLILAGVSIAMLTGDNGILTKATNANDATREAEMKEAINLAVSTIMANKVDPTAKDTDPTVINYTNIANQVKKDNASSKAAAIAGGISYEYGSKTYNVTFKFMDKDGAETTTEADAVGVLLSSVAIAPATTESGS